MQEEAQSVSGEVIDARPSGDEPVAPRAGRLGGFTLGILCLLAFLPGFFGLPPTDREARFAQASRQVYEAVAFEPIQRDATRHNAIVPRLATDAQVGRGPLGHWIQAISAGIYSRGNPHRDAIWMYRIPSLVAAIIMVFLTRRLGEAMFDRSAGRLAALFLIVCPLLAWKARQADSSIMGAAWILGAISVLWQAFSGNAVPLARAALFWVCIAGACLTSGLIAGLIMLLAIGSLGIFSRRWTWLGVLRPLRGLAMAGALIGCWVYFAGLRVGLPQVASSMVDGLIWGDGLGWWPPGLHALLLPILLWPGSMLLPLGIAVAWRLGVKARRGPEGAHPGYAFLMAWIVPAWIALEALPGQDAPSALSLYPALAILGARAMLAAGANALPGLQSGAARVIKVTWRFSGAGFVIAAGAALTVRFVVWPDSTFGTFAAIAVSAIAGLVMLRALRAAWRSLDRGIHANAAFAAAGVMFLTWFTVPTIALPRLLGLSTAAAAELVRIDPSGVRPVAAAGFASDSLVFLTRGRLAQPEDGAVQGWLEAHPQGLLVRRQGLSATTLPCRELGVVSGYDARELGSIRLSIEELAR